MIWLLVIVPIGFCLHIYVCIKWYGMTRQGAIKDALIIYFVIVVILGCFAVAQTHYLRSYH